MKQEINSELWIPQRSLLPIINVFFQTEVNQKNLKLQNKLAYYKEGNEKLQFENDQKKYFNGLTKKDNIYFKEPNQEFIA